MSKRWMKGINKNHSTMSDGTLEGEKFPIMSAPPEPPKENEVFEIKSSPVAGPLCLIRNPWFTQLPVKELKPGDSFNIPFELFRSDQDVPEGRFHHKTVQYMRGQLREYIKHQCGLTSAEIGTKVFKKTQIITVFAKLPVPSPATAPAKAPTKARELLTQREVRPTPLPGHRPTITTENQKALAELLEGSTVSASEMINEIIADFFDSR